MLGHVRLADVERCFEVAYALYALRKVFKDLDAYGGVGKNLEDIDFFAMGSIFFSLYMNGKRNNNL